MCGAGGSLRGAGHAGVVAVVAGSSGRIGDAIGHIHTARQSPARDERAWAGTRLRHSITLQKLRIETFFAASRAELETVVRGCPSAREP